MHVAFILLIFISSSILYLIAKLFKLTKYYLTDKIILITVLIGFFLIALKLAFFEKGYMPWAFGIIFLVARPLFYATTIALIALISFTIFTLKDKNSHSEQKTKHKASHKKEQYEKDNKE